MTTQPPASFDLLVIGTGPAASRVAAKCAAADWKIAIAEKREFGGTCALRGCNPKKVFVRAAELADWARRCQGKLIRSEDVRIDWRELVEFKNSFTDSIPEKSKQGYQKKGITTLSGAARFLKPNELQIGDEIVRSRHVLIATGARPATLGFDGEQLLTTSDEFMELEKLPQRVLFVGGGYISFEFAHVAARAGAQVTIVEHGDRVLKRFSTNLAERLVQHSRQLGIQIETSTEIKSIQRQDAGSLSVEADVGGESKRLAADLVVHGAGRVPNLDDLDLEQGQVQYGESGVKVNEFLQSVSNPAVYAAGDCVDTHAPPLTPVANQQGRTIAQNLLEGNKHKPDYGQVPSAVFTVPALASVGLTETAARQQCLEFELREGDMADWSSVKKVGEPCAAYEILIDKQTDRILGAHLLGPHAEETINLFALAMTFDLTATNLKSVLMTFPTFASDVREMI